MNKTYVEIRNSAVVLERNSHTLCVQDTTNSLSPESTIVHQHFFLAKNQLSNLLSAYSSKITTEHFKETYYDTKDFKYITNGIWIKKKSNREFFQVKTLEIDKTVVRFTEKQLSPIDSDTQYHVADLIGFVTFQVERQQAQLGSDYFYCDRISILEKQLSLQGSDDEEDDDWSYTICTYCTKIQSDLNEKERPGDLLPLGRSKIVRYLYDFEGDVYDCIKSKNYVLDDIYYREDDDDERRAILESYAEYCQNKAKYDDTDDEDAVDDEDDTDEEEEEESDQQ